MDPHLNMLLGVVPSILKLLHIFELQTVSGAVSSLPIEGQQVQHVFRVLG